MEKLQKAKIGRRQSKKDDSNVPDFLREPDPSSPHHIVDRYDEGDSDIEAILSSFRTLQQLRSEETGPTEWFVEGLIPKGGAVLLTGAPKGGGKTTFLVRLLAAIANGEAFLGLQTQSTGFVYLTEQGRNFVPEYLDRHGIPQTSESLYLRAHDTFDFGWEKVVTASVKRCLDQGLRILVVDTITSFAKLPPDGENDSGVVSEALRPLLSAANDAGITVIVVHHDRKSGGSIFHSGRGSSVFQGAVDVIINIQVTGDAPTSPYRKIQVVGRYAGLIEPVAIELTEGGYRNLGAPSTKQVLDREAILDAIPTGRDKAMTLDSIWATFDNPPFSKSKLEKFLKEAVEEGLLEREQLNARGTPYVYWR